jgi:hypothetical protein
VDPLGLVSASGAGRNCSADFINQRLIHQVATAMIATTLPINQSLIFDGRSRADSS